MFTALNVGCMTMVARHKGAGRQDKAQLILRQSLMINLVLSVFFAVLGFAFAHPLVLFMGAQDEQTLLGGMQYLQIQMLGLPFLALTTTITNALHGAGDSKTALFYNTDRQRREHLPELSLHLRAHGHAAAGGGGRVAGDLHLAGRGDGHRAGRGAEPQPIRAPEPARGLPAGPGVHRGHRAHRPALHDRAALHARGHDRLRQDRGEPGHRDARLPPGLA